MNNYRDRTMLCGRVLVNRKTNCLNQAVRMVSRENGLGVARLQATCVGSGAVSLQTVRRRKQLVEFLACVSQLLRGGCESRELQGRWFLTSLLSEACLECY